MTTAAPVNTKEAPRRAVRYATMPELAADLDRIQAAHEAGTLGHTGNWTPGQVLLHCSYLFQGALDGFTLKPAPWPLRKMVVLFFKKKALSGKPLQPGFKLRGPAVELVPPDGTTFEEGHGALRSAVHRVLAGDQMTHPSPIFEHLTHDEWVTLQLGHCSMHLSFISLGD